MIFSGHLSGPGHSFFYPIGSKSIHITAAPSNNGMSSLPFSSGMQCRHIFLTFFLKGKLTNALVSMQVFDPWWQGVTE